jgi:ferredoxin
MRAKVSPCLALGWAVVSVMAMCYLLRAFDFFSFWLTAAAAVLPFVLIYGTHAVWIELFPLACVGWFYPITSSHRGFVALNLAAYALMLGSHRLPRWIAKGVPLAGAAIFFFYLDPPPLPEWRGIDWILTLTALLSTVASSAARPPQPTVLSRIDAVICSFSGHTAHFAEAFLNGAAATGAAIRRHRFHYYDDFTADLDGDALVLAFPVSGWKPPWPLCAWLLRKLPSGRGKPAFLLYTAIGGPENAGMVAYFLLTLKGYRVVGRTWAVYPNNVITFRPKLLPEKVCRAIDRLTPFQHDARAARRFGQEFAGGLPAGFPFLILPTPLFLVGLLLDNRWINILIYRNYTWKLRCIRCGTCIRHCPSQRLYAGTDGFPRARGTCALCMGCLNLCPTNAMQLALWSEYGRPYRTRWPDMVVKRKAAPPNPGKAQA